jgi:hypothetical protein
MMHTMLHIFTVILHISSQFFDQVFIELLHFRWSFALNKNLMHVFNSANEFIYKDREENKTLSL